MNRCNLQLHSTIILPDGQCCPTPNNSRMSECCILFAKKRVNVYISIVCCPTRFTGGPFFHLHGPLQPTPCTAWLDSDPVQCASVPTMGLPHRQYTHTRAGSQAGANPLHCCFQHPISSQNWLHTAILDCHRSHPLWDAQCSTINKSLIWFRLNVCHSVFVLN